MTHGPTFLGLDLAWSRRNPSGLAILDASGSLVEARADLRSDADILAWVRAHMGASAVLGIDMPTIVPNQHGMRACERQLGADLRRAHAAPHPANRRRFEGGGRARDLLDALTADGVRECLDLPPRATGRFAFEVFPHAAHVRLFALETIFKYKKKARPWPLVVAECRRYRAALATLAHADPPLALPPNFAVEPLARGYKAFEDMLDAVTCAYVASFLWRFGTGSPYVRVYGDLENGYIATPAVRWIERASD